MAGLDRIALALALFSEQVLVNQTARPADQYVERRLVELRDAELVRPWKYPRANRVHGNDWAIGQEPLQLTEEAYDEYSQLIADSIEEYQSRTGDRRYRIADLVDLSNELWAECVAAYFGQASLIGGDGRGQRILQKAERAQYDVSVAQKFLSLHGVDSGLYVLSAEEIVGLRTRYGRHVSRIIHDALSPLPSNLGDELVIDHAVGRVVEEYSHELQDLLRRAKPRAGKLAGGMAMDVSGIFVAPVGLYAVFQRLGTFVFARKRAPLQWFVMELKERLSTGASRGA